MNATWPSWVEIRLDQIVHNVQAIKKWIGQNVRLLAVVKANGYGHGAVAASWACLKGGADILGVGSPQEGIELREGGIQSDVFVLGGCFEDQTDLIAQYDLIQCVQNRKIVHSLENAGKKHNKKIRIHIKVDTGMGRLGIYPEDVPELWNAISKCPHIRVEGIFSHLATSERMDKTYAQGQIRRFQELQDQFSQKSIHVPLWHICNSGGTIHFPEAHYDMVRCGLMMYGVYPSREMMHPLKLSPVMSWKSRIVTIKTIPKGGSVSYGRNWIAEKEEKIGVIPLGYHDGYSKRMTHHAELIVRNQKVPTVGDICMDNTMILLSDVPNARIEDEVVLLGKQGNMEISANEMAVWNQSISYETLCTIGRRVPRIYFWKDRQIAKSSFIDQDITVEMLENAKKECSI
jgi:alanine racemase